MCFAEIDRQNPRIAQLELPEPAIRKPVELWTGKQAFSLLLRPNRRAHVFINLENRERQYGTGGPGGKKRDDLHMDLADAYVCFRNSELLCGRLGKGTLGGGNKAGLFQVLSSDYGPGEAVKVMNRLAKLSAKMIGERGFSIGIDDVSPAPRLEAEKAAAVQNGYARSLEYIAKFNKGQLELEPGCDADTSLENVVTGVLNSIREKAAAACMNGLHPTNSPLIMSQCGSKGSPINIAQMVACVGQQSVGGKRAPNGFRNRTLPHFPRGDRTPEGKGFVANSFYSGLNPTEFFFHTMAGREGLVDTAVKTAETGYMSRRLMKALEDLYVHYDASVRNAAGGVVQLRYGEDGMDPMGMEGKGGEPVALDRLLSLARGKWHRLQSALAANGNGNAPAPMDEDAAPVAPNKDSRKGRRYAAKAPKQVPAAPAEGPGDDEEVLLPEELLELAKGAIQERFVASIEHACLRSADPEVGAIPCSEKFLADLTQALQLVADTVAKARSALGLPPSTRGDLALERLLRPLGLTSRELEDFLELCRVRYRDKRVDPGSTVGAFGAQSIGEPGTQMTLKTFHFAGVASMNVTLGVPRIKEIINAAKNISTPLMDVELEGPVGGVAPLSRRPGLGAASQQADAVATARLVKGRLERTTLGQVAASIKEKVFGTSAYIESKLWCIMLTWCFLQNTPDDYAFERAYVTGAFPPCLFLAVELDKKTLDSLQLELTAADVRFKLLDAPRLKLKPNQIAVRGKRRLQVRPLDEKEREKEKDKDKPINVALQALLAALPEVVVLGIPTVTRAVISHAASTSKGGSGKGVVLYVEGTGMLDVMGTLGVEGRAVKNNNIMEVARVLGIEAARSTIIQQIEYTMEQHGMTIDSRHTMLLADCMTNKGEVLGITRFGIAKMKDSVLMLASFEKTTDHLFDAALHGRVDDVTGVSECIIMGIPMPTGTGLFKVMQQAQEEVTALVTRPTPILA